ncbi:MFS transporter [Haloplanus halobius]|uniref:MFS transporter n=1 Tax=Haloplanus halobius TaxID=2934938 RepID=UPI00201024DD|nr:MFS transporter [Haloplanus sp. XH21]
MIRKTLSGVRNGNEWILLTVSFAWLLGLGVRLIYPAVLPFIRTEYGMGLTMAGAVLTLLWLGYGLMQFPGGLLADRVGERNVLVGSIAIAIAGVSLVVLAPAVEAFFAGTLLVGIGVGLYGTTRVTVLVDVYPRHAGTAMGINQAAGNVGTSVLPALAGVLATSLSWRWGFGLLIPLFAVTIVGLWITVPEVTSTESASEPLSRASLVRAARAVGQRSTGYATVSMLLISFVYQSFTGFYPTYLVLEKSFSESQAATFLGVFFASGILVQPLAGALSDAIGPQRTLGGFLSVVVVCLVGLPWIDGTAPLLVLSVLASSLLSFWPVANAYVVQTVDDAHQGTTVGVVRTIYLTLATTGPIFAGALADRDMFDSVFLILAGVTLLAAVVCLAYPSLDD